MSVPNDPSTEIPHTASASLVVPETGPSGPLPPDRFPESLWPVAIRHLEEGLVEAYWVIVGPDWELLAANRTFQERLMAGVEPPPDCFRGLLSPTSEADLREREESGTLEGGDVELVHLAGEEHYSVAYRVYPLEGGGHALFGRDLSRQLELVAQLAILLEETEKEVKEERQRAASLQGLLSNDELTGLPNRRAFREHLDREWETHRVTRRDFAVVTIDIDHFKAVNDRYGHAVGDEVLERVARALEVSVRAKDSVARIGGEEFLLLARETDLEGGKNAAERVRRRVEMTAMPSGVGRVTVSLGVAATSSGEPADLRELLARSDMALYTAKKNGRNRVEAASEET